MSVIKLSPERLLEVHQKVQEAKPPTGWGSLVYIPKFFMGGRRLPEVQVLQKMGQDIGFDSWESNWFGMSLDSKLRKFVLADYDKNLFLPDFMKARSLTTNILEHDERLLAGLYKLLCSSYESRTGIGADSARGHLVIVSRYASEASDILYQAEIDPQAVLSKMVTWRNVVYKSRETQGYKSP